MIRLKQRDGLYVKADYGVTFIGRSLFRSTITLPPNVPVGPLTARVYLAERRQLAQQLSRAKSRWSAPGIERFLHDAAYERPLLYALSTIALGGLGRPCRRFRFPPGNGSKWRCSIVAQQPRGDRVDAFLAKHPHRHAVIAKKRLECGIKNVQPAGETRRTPA